VSNDTPRRSKGSATPSGSAAPAEAGEREPSHGPSGETRRGRRERERERSRSRARAISTHRRSFVERHRSELRGLLVVAAVVLVGGFIIVQSNSKAYACASELVPAPSATAQPNGSPGPLGQVQPDMGKNHLVAPAFQRYASCPPASGFHYAAPGGPLTARYYGPDDPTVPQGWVHNLEHGGLVILYSCDRGACDDATQQALQNLYKTFPNSPICGTPKGQIGPVITRFEDMNAPIAAVLWGRVLFQPKLDTQQILDYFATQAELHNPEAQCARPSPTPASSPSGSPAASAGTSPSGAASDNPSSAPSAGSTSSAPVSPSPS
jgi:hypothetical protein